MSAGSVPYDPAWGERNWTQLWENQTQKAECCAHSSQESLPCLAVAQVNLVPRANLMATNIDEKLGFIFGRRSIRAYTPEP